MSCNPPLEIRLSGPGLTPPIEQIVLHGDWSTPFDVAGVKAIDLGQGTELFFANGFTATIYSDTTVRAEALAALRLANPEAMATKAVPAGSSLAPIGDLLIPAPQ